MHVLVVLVDLRGISFTCKPGKTFLKHINSHWLIRRHQHVESQVKLMPINQQWIGNIPTDNRSVINTHIINVINDVNTFALGRVSRLHYPYVFLAIVLLEFLVVSIEIAKLIR